MTDYLNLIVEVAVTVYVFLLGLPLLVSQILLPEDLRRFSQKNYTGKLWIHLAVLTFLMLAILAISFFGNFNFGKSNGLSEWYPSVSTILFLAMLIETLRFLYNNIIKSQGNRANIVGIIKKRIIKTYQKTGQLDTQFMNDLENLGIYSKAGGEIRFVLDALQEVLHFILKKPYAKVESDHINQIIEILCNSVAGTVEPGSKRNMEDTLTIYKEVMMWLEEIPSESLSLLPDRIAPKLQKCTTQIALVALRKKYISLMPRVLNVLTMLARPSEQLFNIGVLALEQDQFLIATNVLSELLDIDNQDDFSKANFYGILAHFYDAGVTARKHAFRSLKHQSMKLNEQDLDTIIDYHYTCAHFKTVDKLNAFKKELLVQV